MYHNKELKEVFEELDSSNAGLSSSRAKELLEKNGPNALKEGKKKSLFMMFLGQLNDPMIYVLFSAAIISLVVAIIEKSNDWVDSIIIFAVIMFNAIIGVVQEKKASNAMEALKNMSSPLTQVLRDGQIISLPSKELVIGDIVYLEEGNIVPADLRLIEAINLKIDESSLTGESVPVNKNIDIITKKDTSLGDLSNLAFSSTIVTYGRGKGIVIGTGMNTEIGKIAKMLDNDEDNLTPLQKKLASLSKLLGFITLGIILVMLIISLAYDGFKFDNILSHFLLAISLAVAAIPEGLVAVVTIVLSLGVERMAKNNAIIRKLPSVETLGSIDVICSDKTGTLTQNKMTVTEVYCNEKLDLKTNFSLNEVEFLSTGFALCSNATIENGRTGDPTEIALVDYLDYLGFKKSEKETSLPRVEEYPFDSVRKMMTTRHSNGDKTITFTKGALDSILLHTTRIKINDEIRLITQEDIDNIYKASKEMSSKALRVLALAYHEDGTLNEENLIFVGLVGMKDPIREECIPAIISLKNAGIRTIMITGDHIDTAFSIGKELGIVEKEEQCLLGSKLDNMTEQEIQEVVKHVNVFGRVSPNNKVQIVKALKANGLLVAMTGDGVNDAPSLKAADIGIAMGITGTDVAKDAADMVLSDDNFATIEKAVVEGRNIYANLKKTIIFLLSSNMAEVLVLFICTILGLPTPLIAIHLLWINLITDSLPAISLGVDKSNDHLMTKQVETNKGSFFNKKSVTQLITYSIIISIITLFGFIYFPCVQNGVNVFDIQGIISYFGGHAEKLKEAQTCAFSILGLSELFLMISMSNDSKSFVSIIKSKNFIMLGAFVLGLVLQILVTEVPFLNNIFKTTQIDFIDWLIISSCSIIPLVVHEIIVLIKFIRSKKAR